MPIATLCISGWQGALLAGIPVCPPIGASFKKSRYLLHSPQLGGLHRMAKKGVTLSRLRSREQCPLFSPALRCKRLQFELCNLIRCRTHPVTQPQEGGLTLRLLSRRSTLRQPPHVLIFHSFLICTLSFFPTLIPLSLCSCCLPFDLSLIPHYCLVICEQTRQIVLLVFVQ